MSNLISNKLINKIQLQILLQDQMLIQLIDFRNFQIYTHLIVY